MMEKLVKFVEAYYEQIGAVVGFNQTVITQLLQYYDSGIMNELFSMMKGANDSQLDFIQYRKDLGKKPEIFVEVSILVRKANQSLLRGVDTALQVEVVPEIQKYIKKIGNSSNVIIGYIDEILRIYLVNIPDDLLEQTLLGLKGELLDDVIESVRATVASHPDDSNAQMLLQKLERRKEVEKIVEEGSKPQKDSEEDEKTY